MIGLSRAVTTGVPILVIAICTGSGCHRAKPKPLAEAFRPLHSALPQIRSFSETQPFLSFAELSGMIYAGTPRGVVRFDQRTGEFVRLTVKEGLQGGRVSALSGHPASGLWVATERGISRFQEGVWTNFPAPQPPRAVITSMVAMSWGVWIGGPGGLVRLKEGRHKTYLPGARVSTLLAGLSGEELWVGTDGEGIYQYKDDGFISHSPAKGQVIRQVRGMTLTPSGGLLAIGQHGSRDVITFFDGSYWVTYTPDPAGELHWVHQVASGVLLAYNDRLLLLERMDAIRPDRAGPEQVGPVQLKATSTSPDREGSLVPRFATRPLDRWLPLRPTGILGRGQEVLVGTSNLGLLLYDGKKASWFRTNDLVGDLEKLQVGCSSKLCYLAGGNGRAYRFDGKAFEPVSVASDPSIKIVSMLNAPSGEVISIHVSGDGRSLVVSRLAGDRFTPAWTRDITIPRGKVGVRFARFDPAGKLWLGLSYKEEDGTVRPWGIAVVAREGKEIMYHRSTLMAKEDRPPGSLALPDDIRDVQFSQGYTWLATGAGACRIKGDQVALFTENEGLESEIIHRFAFRPNGEVLAATHGGIGRFDGKQWLFDFDEPLRHATRALLLESGVMWAGTSRGLVRRDGRGDTKIIDSIQGLAGDVVRDLYRDPHGRLWVLTDQGLSIVDRVP